LPPTFDACKRCPILELFIETDNRILRPIFATPRLIRVSAQIGVSTRTVSHPPLFAVEEPKALYGNHRGSRPDNEGEV